MKNAMTIVLMVFCTNLSAQKTDHVRTQTVNGAIIPDTSSFVITPTRVSEYAFPTRKVLSRRECNDTVVINTPPHTIQYFHFMDKFANKGAMVRDVTIAYLAEGYHEHLVLESENNMYGGILGPLTIFIGKSRKPEENEN